MQFGKSLYLVLHLCQCDGKHGDGSGAYSIYICGGQRTEVREGHRGGREEDEEDEKDDDDDDVDAHECPSLSRLVLFIVKKSIFYFLFS